MNNPFYNINGSYASIDSNNPIYNYAIIGDIKISNIIKPFKNKQVFGVEAPIIEQNTYYSGPQLINNVLTESLDIHGYQKPSAKIINMYDNVNINGSINISDDLFIKKNTFLNGNLNVTKHLNISGDIISSEAISGKNIISSELLTGNLIYGKSMISKNISGDDIDAKNLQTNKLFLDKNINVESNNLYSSILNDDQKKSLLIIGNRTSDCKSPSCNSYFRNVNIMDNLNVSNKLCVGDTCIDESHLKQLLNQYNISYKEEPSKK